MENPLTQPNSGFRPGQLGALHAVLSHFSVYDDPAIVSLPTGYGKTAVIMALPFILKAKRLLVVEPSDALRKQTTSHFKELSTLRKLSVAPDTAKNPSTHSQNGTITTADEWKSLAGYDVVVSTPQSSSPLVSPGANPDLFDLIVFDEAHHAPADTWAAYLGHFPDARFVFLTATPFRRDRKPIPGRIAYHYPVLRASRENAFGKVLFKPANPKDDQNEDEIDKAVAVAAFDQLRADNESGYDHRIFARAASIPKAKTIKKFYDDIGCDMAVVASHIVKSTQDKIETRLVQGDIHGIICVDMFGEGYDFPKFKIAALHAPHKSLVPTLQFIGRFARTNDEKTGNATLIAPLSRIKDANEKLFQEGIDIAELIDEAAVSAISAEAANREILEVLKPRFLTDSDYEAVTPLLLQLYAHARVFSCGKKPDFTLFTDTIAKRLMVKKKWMSDDESICMLLTADHSPPNWATSDTIANLRHDAFLLAYNEATKLCYIGSTRRTDKLYWSLMDTVCPGRHRPLSYEAIRRVLTGLDDLRFYNVGLKNTAVNSQAESYRILAGPRAEHALTSGDARAYVQGHFFGSGTGENARETIGASSGSRVWSNKRLTVSAYIDWVSELNRRLNSDQTISPSRLDIVQHSQELKTIPERIIGASWNKIAYRYAPRIRYRNVSANPDWSYRQITDFELDGFSTSSDKHSLNFNVTGEDQSFEVVFSLRDGEMFNIMAKDWEVEVLSGIDDWTELAAWLAINPPVFFSVDKSSFQGVNKMSPPSNTIHRLVEGSTQVITWGDTDITVEFDRSKASGRPTVQDFIREMLLNDQEAKIVLFDHRTGEAADFIAISIQPDEIVNVSLYHCKGAGGVQPGKRVGDVYEVAGQMLKSVAYCDSGNLFRHVQHRINPDRHKTPSSFIKGDMNSFEEIITNTNPNNLRFSVFGVQPGISESAIDDSFADLMAFGVDYLTHGGAAQACWLISK